MSPLLVSFEQKENYLLVTGHGTRDNLAMMAEASAQIYKKIEETHCEYLLADYRNLVINVHMSEAFNIVKRYEVHQPRLKTLTMAAVFEGKGMEFGKYWTDISRQRGFHIELFDNMQKAEQWLLEEIKKKA